MEYMELLKEVQILAGLISFIGVIIVAEMNHRNNIKSLKQQKELHEKSFQDNVVSKARIEWIQEVRKVGVKFISSTMKTLDYIELIDSQGYFLEKAYKGHNYEGMLGSIERDEKLTGLIQNVSENGNHLILYFGPNQSYNNSFLVFLVEKLIKHIGRFEHTLDQHEFKDYIKDITTLRDFLRIYLKAEWKRANGSIGEKDIQKYLEKHTLYNDIIARYSKEFDDQ